MTDNINIENAQTQARYQTPQDAYQPINQELPRYTPVNAPVAYPYQGYYPAGNAPWYNAQMEMQYHEQKNPHKVAIVLGYLFALLGGWFGIVFGVYLLTRDHPKARKQGKIITPLTVVSIIIWYSIILS